MGIGQICVICKAYMRQHRYLRGWLICICGFCKMEKEVITLKDYWMGRNEEYSQDLTKEIEENAAILVSRVNAFLTELGVTTAEVSSGWRPLTINNATPGASKGSAHLTGEAVDLLDDKDQSLAKKIQENIPLLEKFDLYLENPTRTIGKHTNWAHLQTRKAKSGRVFQP